jgi:hypothetical protein
MSARYEGQPRIRHGLLEQPRRRAGCTRIRHRRYAGTRLVETGLAQHLSLSRRTHRHDRLGGLGIPAALRDSLNGAHHRATGAGCKVLRWRFFADLVGTSGWGADAGSVPLDAGKLVDPERWLAGSSASVSEAKRNNSRGPLTQFQEGLRELAGRGNGPVKLLGDILAS